MTVQVIEKNGTPEWAVIPYADYIRLLEEAEELEDIRDYEAIKKAIEAGEEELVPGELAFAIAYGENPIRVWREHRELTQVELAEKAGISKPYLSQIESGKRKGSAKVLSAIAQALNLDIDDIL